MGGDQGNARWVSSEGADGARLVNSEQLVDGVDARRVNREGVVGGALVKCE